MSDYKLVPVEPTEFSKGDTDPHGDCGMFVAGINHNPSRSPRDQWGHRIEVYGDTPEHAEELRDRVLRALAAPDAQGESVDEDDVNRAMEMACELGGLEDGSYHLEADELEKVIRTIATSPDVSGLVGALMVEATGLCDAVENINDLPAAQYALQAGRAVNKVRDAVAALSTHREQEKDHE